MADDPRLLFGRGAELEPATGVVVWPDGAERRFGPLTVDRCHLVRRSGRR